MVNVMVYYDKDCIRIKDLQETKETDFTIAFIDTNGSLLFLVNKDKFSHMTIERT